jgi:hypothetical protein
MELARIAAKPCNACEGIVGDKLREREREREKERE